MDAILGGAGACGAKSGVRERMKVCEGINLSRACLKLFCGARLG